MQKVRLCLDVEYDPAFGSAENLASWFDNLLKGAICDDHTCDHSLMESFGQPAIGHIRVEEGQTLAIIVRDGMVDEVLCDSLNLDVLVVDHDTDCMDEDELVTITLTDCYGDECDQDVILRGETVIVNPTRIRAILAARKQQVAAWAREADDENL